VLFRSECFLVDPERYVPAFGGNDPVLMIEQRQNVPGKVDHCASFDGRLYMFSNPATLGRFRQDPRRYILPVQSR